MDEDDDDFEEFEIEGSKPYKKAIKFNISLKDYEEDLKHEENIDIKQW